MSQTHHGLRIHVVFSTRNRLRVIGESWRNDLYGDIGSTAREHKAVLAAAGGTADHIHLLLQIHPSFAVSDTLRHLKANSSRWINEHGHTSGKFEWQRGYGAFSVSHSMSEQVRAYIHNQQEHHRQMSFRDEYLSFLRRHEIEFDDRYVFDEEVVG